MEGKMARKKTWREKLLDSNDFPKVVLLTPALKSNVKAGLWLSQLLRK
jgi:hypothetical protein